MYQPGWYLEAIDAAESVLVYEGLNNVRNLVFLQYLDVSYNGFVDEWFLDRITGEYRDSLEYLDISGCSGLDSNGIECVWRLRHLKTIVMYDMDHVEDLPLLCLMLLEVFPNLEIKGVEYMQTELLEGTEHQHLLRELEEMLLLPSPRKDGEKKEYAVKKIAVKSQNKKKKKIESEESKEEQKQST